MSRQRSRKQTDRVHAYEGWPEETFRFSKKADDKALYWQADILAQVVAKVNSGMSNESISKAAADALAKIQSEAMSRNYELGTLHRLCTEYGIGEEGNGK